MVAVYFLVLSESLAWPLWQSVGSRVQHERWASDARDDVTEIRQATLVRRADRHDVRWSQGAKYNGFVCQDSGCQTSDVTNWQ